MTQKMLIGHDEYTNNLYKNSDFFLKTNHYKNLLDKEEFKTKLTGVTFDNRQENIKNLTVGEELLLVHDKDNAFHKNAIRVTTINGDDLGFLPRELADEMIKVLDENDRLVFVEDITGDSDYDDFLGVNIAIQKISSISEDLSKSYPVTMKKEDMLEAIAKELGFLEVYYRRKEEINKSIRNAYVSYVGNDEYEKKTMLAIVSVYKYMKYKQRFLFLYNDNSAIIEDAKIFQLISSKFDIHIQELNVEQLKKEDFPTYMENNNIGILVATYVDLHQIQLDYDFGMVVHNHFDQNLDFIQMHEINQLNVKTTIYNHYNFNKLSKEELEEQYGVKTFLEICAEGYIRDVSLIDKRNITDKDLFIINFLIKEEKTIIYTNTRRTSVSLAKNLRNKLPREMKNKIIYYHSGIPLEDRKRIEEKFQKGEYLFVVATTAFDIALHTDNVIENIFINNPPYTYNAFLNQIVQTAKYNKCKVYLTYSYRDVHESKRIIQNNLVDKSDLMYVYRSLQVMLYEKFREKYGFFNIKDHQLRNKIIELYSKTYNMRQLQAVLETLEEMKVIEFDKKSNDYYIEVRRLAQKSNFEKTQTYLKNKIMKEMFVEYELLLLDFNIKNIRNELFNM